MTPPDEAMIVEQSRRFLHKREELSRSYRFLLWFGCIGSLVLPTVFAPRFYEKMQTSLAPAVLAEGFAYGFVGVLALFSFGFMTAGLIFFAARSKIDRDYVRHALLVKYHDALFPSSSTVLVTSSKNP